MERSRAVRHALRMLQIPAAERLRICLRREGRILIEKNSERAKTKRVKRRILKDSTRNAYGWEIPRSAHLGSGESPMMQRWNMWKGFGEIFEDIKANLRKGWKAYRDSLPDCDRVRIMRLPG